jgi:hypothetical protein
MQVGLDCILSCYLFRLSDYLLLHLLLLTYATTVCTAYAASPALYALRAVSDATRAHITKVAPRGAAAYGAAWRDSVFIEYYYNDPATVCGKIVDKNETKVRSIIRRSINSTVY